MSPISTDIHGDGYIDSGSSSPNPSAALYSPQPSPHLVQHVMYSPGREPERYFRNVHVHFHFMT
jgi:hypothetical protein